MPHYQYHFQLKLILTIYLFNLTTVGRPIEIWIEPYYYFKQHYKTKENIFLILQDKIDFTLKQCSIN